MMKADRVARALAQAAEPAFRLATNYTDNPNFRKWNPKYRDTFGDLTRWTPVSGANVADDPNNYTVHGSDKRETGAWVRTSGHALKLTKATTTAKEAKVTCTFSNPLDLSGSHALLKYYIHEGSGSFSYTKLYAVYLFMYDSAGKYGYWSDTGARGAAIFKPGWRTRPFRMLDYASEAGFDITTVSKLEIRIQTAAGDEAFTPSVTFDSLDFIPKLTLPIPYIMTADGGYIAQKKVLAYMAAIGIRCHLYVTYDNIGKSGYMTMKDLQDAQEMGHFIDTHEREAGVTGWLTMSKSQRLQSLREALVWKAKNGFLSGRGFCTLGAQWYHDEDDIEFLSSYVEHIRIGGDKNNVPFNPRVLGVSYDTNDLTVETEAVKRQQAIDRGTYYVGLIHSLKVGTFTIDDCKTIIDAAIDDPNVKFMTIPELIRSDLYA